MFLLPARGEEIAHGRRIAQVPQATNRRIPDFSPSSSFSLPRLLPPEIGRQRSISGGNGAKKALINGTAR
ncbi:hypothetical protein BHE74_00016064 [Ensete ventricosum]|nr:hypothetical protein GW17_00008964 [Ensete ventricosum]RWW75874.1 hypothetical protein BHE74_00016064 [Ensete ventricosum]RZS22133.1 hypothetical protein BHM03_00054911 [Ensete ventricosum]